MSFQARTKPPAGRRSPGPDPVLPPVAARRSSRPGPPARIGGASRFTKAQGVRPQAPDFVGGHQGRGADPEVIRLAHGEAPRIAIVGGGEGRGRPTSVPAGSRGTVGLDRPPPSGFPGRTPAHGDFCRWADAPRARASRGTFMSVPPRGPLAMAVGLPVPPRTATGARALTPCELPPPGRACGSKPSPAPRSPTVVLLGEEELPVAEHLRQMPP